MGGMAIFTETVVLFIVSLLIGALGIHVGAVVIAGVENYGKAVLTALAGALVWGIANYFLSGVPLLGPALTLVAYIGVIKYLYKESWLRSGGIALLAWIVAVGILTVLSKLGVEQLKAVGIPRL